MTDRFPPIDPAALTPAQATAFAEIEDGPRGAVAGPFIPLLRSPELMRRVQATGEYLRYRSPLPAAAREFAVLLVARQWDQAYEWSVHAPLALAAGVDPHLVSAVADRRVLPDMDDLLAVVHAVFAELVGTKAVSDDTHRRGVAALGEGGVVDLVGLIGYYTLLAMILNVAQTPVPPTGFMLPP